MKSDTQFIIKSLGIVLNEEQEKNLRGLLDEIEKLELENWQLRQACGYPIPADKETPQNPFKCGVCDARSKSWHREGIEDDHERDRTEALDSIGWFGHQ